jgi:hypothetical protein
MFLDMSFPNILTPISTPSLPFFEALTINNPALRAAILPPPLRSHSPPPLHARGNYTALSIVSIVLAFVVTFFLIPGVIYLMLRQCRQPQRGEQGRAGNRNVVAA